MTIDDLNTKSMTFRFNSLCLHNLRLLFLFCWVALIVSGCSGLGRSFSSGFIGTTEFQPLRFNAVPWQDGETGTYHIVDGNGENAGVMTIALTNHDNEFWLMTRQVDGRTQETVEVTMKASNLRPKETMILRTDSEGREMVRGTFDGSQVDLELTTRVDAVTYERQSIPSNSYDYQTLLMLLRALPLTNGYATRINAYLPIAGLLERIEIVVSIEESLALKSGPVPAWRILLRAQNSRSEAWIGQEAPYPLLKYVDGTTGATFELSEFRRS